MGIIMHICSASVATVHLALCSDPSFFVYLCFHPRPRSPSVGVVAHPLAKVEEWLLNAGQSGWTPEQFAFESVVLLFSERDVAKAEEWLSRSLQTDYRLPDVCYDAVVQALVLSRDSMRVADWIQRMVQDGRTPNDQTLQEAILLFVEVG